MPIGEQCSGQSSISRFFARRFVSAEYNFILALTKSKHYRNHSRRKVYTYSFPATPCWSFLGRYFQLVFTRRFLVSEEGQSIAAQMYSFNTQVSYTHQKNSIFTGCCNTGKWNIYNAFQQVKSVLFAKWSLGTHANAPTIFVPHFISGTTFQITARCCIFQVANNGDGSIVKVPFSKLIGYWCRLFTKTAPNHLWKPDLDRSRTSSYIF